MQHVVPAPFCAGRNGDSPNVLLVPVTLVSRRAQRDVAFGRYYSIHVHGGQLVRILSRARRDAFSGSTARARPDGGPERIVQIDEAKFGRRKYYHGHRIDGHWLFGMIEDGSSNFRLEICPDNKRTAEALLSLIQRYVAAGMTVHTDAWHTYRGLLSLGYLHETVNHS